MSDSGDPTPQTAPTTFKRERSPTPETDGRNAKRVHTEGETESSKVTAKMEDVRDSDGKPVAANSNLPAGHDSLPPTPQTHAPPQSAGSGGQAASQSGSSAPGSQIINMRCLIVTMDASVIIGKGGKHIADIRAEANARVNISESIQGNPERILSVQGALDAVAKAFGLIVRRINDEPFDQPSLPGSRAVTIKFMIPNSRMGSVIGKGGSKIKEIQEASGARLNASEQMLPGSTERILSVAGVADAVHIAVYYIGTILLEYQERVGGGAPSREGRDGSYRQSGYTSERRGGAGAGAPRQPSSIQPGPGSAVQQFWIPDGLVGSIIGKAGIKINEIRTQSQCHIRVTDPGTPATPGGAVNPGERLIIISGHPNNLMMAVNMLHARLEQEKQKKAQAEGY